MARIDTVKQVVDIVGRQTLMDLLGVTSGSISNWLNDGRFPDRASMFRTVRDACAAHGHEVDEGLFGKAEARAVA